MQLLLPIPDHVGSSHVRAHKSIFIGLELLEQRVPQEVVELNGAIVQRARQHRQLLDDSLEPVLGISATGQRADLVWVDPTEDREIGQCLHVLVPKAREEFLFHVPSQGVRGCSGPVVAARKETYAGHPAAGPIDESFQIPLTDRCAHLHEDPRSLFDIDTEAVRFDLGDSADRLEAGHRQRQGVAGREQEVE